ILCYDSEETVGAWSKQEEAATMARLGAVRDQLAAEGRLGPVARLMPTTAAPPVRKSGEQLVLDGPFAETKEQLLGFYVVDCPGLEAAIEVARRLARANSQGVGAYEIRPIRVFHPTPGAPMPGTLVPEAT